ncbi:MAG TPA: OstA-like protein [Ferruginibacter sp.]|nr:OstA-like protein [Ferruginibacter sp.]HMP22002.1 OstA-like protein [Ferruginibacter sp.]
MLHLQLYHTNRYSKWLFVCCILLAPAILQAQTTADTIRLIKIIKGQSLREKKIDSANSYQTIAGNVHLSEGNTSFFCDSAVINRITNIVEAFGNIHINQQDSIHTYAQYMRYLGNDRIAFLRRDVKLTDKKGTLTTQELEYDLKNSIGKYTNGGKVVNGKTVLTSREGVYYTDTRDIFFKQQVHLTDPKYTITSDSLQYNTLTELATFITATYIKSKDGGDIFTTSGTYDLKKGKAFFGSRSIFKDSTRTYIADNSAIDEASGIAQLEGNAIIKDSVNGYTVMGNQIFLDKNKNSFLATRKPILIFKGEGNDSTFIAADTLFSGVEIRNPNTKQLVQANQDTLQQTTVITADTALTAEKELQLLPVSKKNIPGTDTTGTNNLLAAVDTLATHAGKADSTVLPPPAITAKDSTILNKMVHSADSSNATITDTTGNVSIPVQQLLLPADTLVQQQKNDTVRYFIAFHHVRIFNDSLQSVCDSLYYSSQDSIFRLYKDPLVFANKSQVSGDTIHLYTKNKKADRIYVFYNGMIINKLNSKMYNQVAGRTLDGYFKEGNIDYMRAKGQPAESIFYPQDNDSAITGMNRCNGEVIDIYFQNKEVHRVKFINDVSGTFFPIRQVPADQQFLNKFEWLDRRRPKNKLELFE